MFKGFGFSCLSLGILLISSCASAPKAVVDQASTDFECSARMVKTQAVQGKENTFEAHGCGKSAVYECAPPSAMLRSYQCAPAKTAAAAPTPEAPVPVAKPVKPVKTRSNIHQSPTPRQTPRKKPVY
jgi:hypothetical protein